MQLCQRPTMQGLPHHVNYKQKSFYIQICKYFDFEPLHRCGCDDCVSSSQKDSLRHSQARINAYRALTSSSLIALSSKDPLLTAFELSWELRRLSHLEQEFRAEYNVIYLLLMAHNKKGFIIPLFHIFNQVNFVFYNKVLKSFGMINISFRK